MNRCFPTTARPTTLLTALAGLGAAVLLSLAPFTAAHAQTVQRNFPDKALRGSMVVVQPPLVAMDDRPTRFSPGARIHNTNNTLVRPATLVNKEITVNYTTDQRGQIHQVWILTEAEAKEKRPGYGTQRNFSFESQQTAPAGSQAPATN